MPTSYCIECGTRTVHLAVKAGAETAPVTRTTIHNWLRRSLPHRVVRPSGRSFICECSQVKPWWVSRPNPIGPRAMAREQAI